MNNADIFGKSDQSKSKMAEDFNLIQKGQFLNDWFVFREERHFGPLTTEQVNKLLLQRKISIHHHIWRPGFKDWMSISEVENFRACGVGEIDFIDDNFFSEDSELEAIDLIAPDLKTTSFVGSWLDKITAKRKLWNEKVQGLMLALGMSEETKVELTKYVMLTGLVCIASVSLWMFWPSQESIFNGLSKGVKDHLIHVSKQPESKLNIQFAAFNKSLNQPDPVFVMGTNLPVGSMLRVSLTGDPQTLLGALNFNKVFELKLEDKIFHTPMIRGRNGQFIPAGTYSLAVTCLSCGAEGKRIFEQKYNLGMNNLEDYQQQLQIYHKTVKQAAKLELQELDSLAEVLAEQYRKTLNGFVGQATKVSEWESFSTNWLKNQNHVVDVFGQLEAEDVKDKIYYLSLYKSYKQLAQSIFELHVMQDALLKKSKNSGALSKEIANASHNISLNLTHLKSQIDLMSMQAQNSEGLPVKSGLDGKAL